MSRPIDEESTSHPWLRGATLVARLVVLLAFLATAPRAVIAACEESAAYSYCERAKENTTLIVLVAGLGYKDTWEGLVKLIDRDRDLSALDYLLYHSPPELDLDGNVQLFTTILEDLRSKAKYQKRVYVGHSLGGLMVKWLTLGVATQQPAQLPKIIMTFGTPLDTDRFDVDWFRKGAAKIFWFNRKPLEKEVFNDGRVKDINLSWRTAVKSGPLSKVRQVSVFGDADWIAPANQEKTDSEISVLVRGNHSTILPKTSDDCSYRIFKAVMRDQNAVLADMDCILKDVRQ